MAFKEIADLSPDTTIALGGTNKKTGKPNPTKVEGYYLGKRTVEDRKKKSGFSYIYVLQTVKGNVGVWGKTDLDRKMQDATVGNMLRITQSGVVPTPNGDMYKFKVEFDADNSIDVLPVGSSNETADGGYGEDTTGTEDDEDNGDNDGLDDSNSYAASASGSTSAERAAKVAALLKGSKNGSTVRKG